MRALVFPVTGTSMEIDMSVGDYSVTKPAAICQVRNSTNAVNIVEIQQNIAALGYVYTGWTLTFASGDIGKTACLISSPSS